jgi:hypothetical protein
VAEAARLAQLDNDLRHRQAAIEQAEKLYRDSAEIKRQADAQAHEIQRAMADAQSREAAAEKAELKAREERDLTEQAAARARADQQRSKRLLLEGQAKLQQAEAIRADAMGHITRAESLFKELATVQGHLLPIAFRGEPWRTWREELIRRAASDGSAYLLLARLHTAAALERSERPLPMELARDIGRSVYEADSAHAEKIAQALTEAARGQFDIKTVRTGDRVDNKFMKPAMSGLVEVRAVSGWAVRDAKGSWQFLAEVS